MEQVRVISLLLIASTVGAGALPFGTAAVTTSAEIANLLPDVADVSVPALVNPTAGETTLVPVTITVGDGNGFQDIASVKVTVYKPDGTTVHVAQASATPNNDGSGTAATYSYSFPMQYYDDPASGDESYSVSAIATDATGATSGVQTATFEYGALAAMELSTEALEFGSVAPGARSAPALLGIANKGNVRLDIQTSGSDLSDGSGNSIGRDHIRYDLASSDFTSERSLTSAPYTNSDFDLEKGPSSSRSTHWALEAPSGDDQYIPSGTYTGTLTVSAIQG